MKFTQYNTDISFFRLNLEIENGVFLVAFGYEDFRRRESSLHTHKMNDYTLQFVEFGEGILKLEGKTYVLKKHDLFYLPYNVPLLYKKNPKNPYKYFWISFKGPKVEKFLKRTMISIKKPVIHIENGEEMLALFKSLDPINVPSVYRMKAVFYSVFAALQAPKKYVPTHLTNRLLVDDIADYIKINYTNTELSIAQIADQFFISPTQLYRIFLKEIGVSAKQYLIDYRMEKAKELLSEGTTITYAAYNSGFSDLYYFSKFFKKTYGCSPSEYQKSASPQRRNGDPDA